MCGCILQEDSFHLVDNKPAQRKQGMRRFQPNRFQQRRDQQNQRGDMQVHQDRQPRKQQNKRPQFFHRNEQRVRFLTALHPVSWMLSCHHTTELPVLQGDHRLVESCLRAALKRLQDV